MSDENVIPFNETENEPQCSFCKVKKSAAEKKMLIQSRVNSHHICVKCVAKASARIETSRKLCGND